MVRMLCFPDAILSFLLFRAHHPLLIHSCTKQSSYHTVNRSRPQPCFSFHFKVLNKMVNISVGKCLALSHGIYCSLDKFQLLRNLKLELVKVFKLIVKKKRKINSDWPLVAKYYSTTALQVIQGYLVVSSVQGNWWLINSA